MAGPSAPDFEQGALPPGSMFHEHYEVIACLSSGGMGAVYQVLDHRTRRKRALKLMLPSIVPDPEWRARFKLEATITSDIDSEHLVETFDAGVDGATGAPFLVMELLKGEDLGALLRRRGALPAAEVVQLLYQAALGLERTHAAGIVHRDLKPANLFITTRDDGQPRLKVLDFGVAKVVAEGALTSTTRTLGTPMYMAPEQIHGENLGPRADVYAIGQLAYTMLTGVPYWRIEADETENVYQFFTRVVEGTPEAPSVRAAGVGVTLPPAFDAWFSRATATDVADRYPSVDALVEGLAAALEVAPPTSAPRAVSAPSIPSVGSGRSAVLAPDGPGSEDGQTLTSTVRIEVERASTLDVSLQARTGGAALATGETPPSASRGRGGLLAGGLAGAAIVAAAVYAVVFAMKPAASAPTVVAPPVREVSAATVAPPAPPPPADARSSEVPPAASAPAVAVSGPARSAPPRAGAPRAAIRQTPSASATPPPPRPAPRCDPPFYLDESGRKIFKRECLE